VEDLEEVIYLIVVKQEVMVVLVVEDQQLGKTQVMELIPKELEH
jgi:hypothetical protein